MPLTEIFLKIIFRQLNFHICRFKIYLKTNLKNDNDLSLKEKEKFVEIYQRLLVENENVYKYPEFHSLLGWHIEN